MKDRIFCVFGLKMPIQAPREFGGRDPQMGSIVNDIPKGTSFLGIKWYNVQIGTSVCAQLTLLANPQNLSFIMLFNWPDTLKSAPGVCGGICVLHPHLTYAPNCSTIGSAILHSSQQSPTLCTEDLEPHRIYRGFRAWRFYINLLPVFIFYTIRQISTSPTSLWHQFF